MTSGQKTNNSNDKHSPTADHALCGHPGVRCGGMDRELREHLDKRQTTETTCTVLQLTMSGCAAVSVWDVDRWTETSKDDWRKDRLGQQ